MNKKFFGIIMVLGASIMWALEPVFVKLAYGTNDFSQVLISRSIFAGCLAFVYCIIKNRNFNFFQINKQQFAVIFTVSVINTLIADVLYYIAIATIPVVNAVLIGHLQPILVIFFGYFVLKEEKPSRNDYLGVILMILAGLFVSIKTFENLTNFNIGSRGDFLVLLAMGGWASTTIMIKKYLNKTDSSTITFYRFFIASTVFLLYLTFNSISIFSNWYQVAIGAIVGFGYIMFYEGLKLVKAVQASALELAAPFFGAILGFFILGEFITTFQTIGMVSLAFGVYFLSKKE